MNAASPGVIALFFRNDHYASREEYVYAIADAMRVEYEAITDAGLLLQIDCPDLGMGRHIQFADKTLERVPRRGAAEHRGAQPRDARTSTPERCASTSAGATTRARTTATSDFKDIVDLVFTARPSAIAFEAANPRHAHEWKIFEDVKLPDGKVLIPGVLESKATSSSTRS